MSSNSQEFHPATGSAQNYHFDASLPPTFKVGDVSQQADTQPADGKVYAAEPGGMSQSESSSSGTKVSFKEQVIGFAQKTRGTLLGKPDLKAHGDAILEGQTTHEQDRPKRK